LIISVVRFLDGKKLVVDFQWAKIHSKELINKILKLS